MFLETWETLQINISNIASQHFKNMLIMTINIVKRLVRFRQQNYLLGERPAVCLICLTIHSLLPQEPLNLFLASNFHHCSSFNENTAIKWNVKYLHFIMPKNVEMSGFLPTFSPGDQAGWWMPQGQAASTRKSWGLWWYEGEKVGR